MTKRPTIALFAFAFALACGYALVASWTPIQGDDWNNWIWAGRHRGESGWLPAFAISHFTFSDLVGYALARSQAFHVLVTPAVHLALIAGLFTVAMRRTPRATWTDLLGLALVSTLLWIAQPSAGVTLFQRTNVATFVYGAAVAVWYFAPFRCNWRVPTWAMPLLVLGGYCAGTSSRAIATATLVGVILMMRVRRERWMYVALGALVVGTIVGYLDPPWLEVSRVVKRGFEQNLAGQGLLKYIIEEGGEIVSLVLALLVVNHTLGVFGRPAADAEQRPETTDALRWLGAWFATAIWCMFGPRYNEATLLPATCVLVIGALPYVLWLATSRFLRIVVVTFAVAVHAIVWPLALRKYRRCGAEGAARMAAFQHAKPGGRAFIAPFTQIAPDFWFPGEDLYMARVREPVAVEAFGLRDIVFVDDFRRLDPDPGVAMKLEVDGATDAQLQAAHVPAFWADELTTARKQFELFAKRLRVVTGKRVSARLRVTNVEGFTDPRPIYAAWSDEEGTMIPRTQRSSIDPNARITVRIYAPEARKFSEAYDVTEEGTMKTQYHGGSPELRPRSSTLAVVLACNDRRCLAIDAFIPRF